MTIILVGLNHRTAPLALRERLALDGERLQDALDALRCTGCTDAPLRESVILSTCNRFEIYAESESNIRVLIEGFIAALGGFTPEVLRDHLYTLEGDAAVKHLLRVAAGLESMVLGETQVLGQVAQAADAARDAGTMGATLARLFTQAARAGKRARTETAISRHTTSVSHAAARLIRETTGSEARALIVGAGEMATLAAHALNGHEIAVINRTPERAEALAAQVGGRALDWSRLREALAWADVVISATRGAVICAADVDRRKDNRRLLLIDISMPRSVEAAVAALPGVDYRSLDDLHERVEAGTAQRRAAVPQVEAIISEEAAQYAAWEQGRDAVPLINALQNYAHAIAESELRAALNRIDHDAHTEQVLARMAHRIVAKLLHEPTIRLKLNAADPLYADAARDLFGLAGFADDPAEAGDEQRHA